MRDETSVRTGAWQAQAWLRRQAAAAMVGGLAFCCAAGANAAGWQWLDASGRKVFSDMPPPAAVPDKSILQRPDAASSGPSLPPPASALPAPAAPAGKPGNGGAPTTLAAGKDRNGTSNLSDAELRAAVDKRNAEIRQMNCRRAREDLAALAAGTRLLVLNERGEPVVLDEDRRAAEVRRLQRSEQENCQPPQNGKTERAAPQ
ncbi:MAG: hypothetical protein RJA36_3798 [Pseudomonadota bacterium]|jgi:hypothetical protein